MNEEVIYFSVNNWFSGRDYPETENFIKWLGDDSEQYFADDNWCKENKLCVYYGVIDMSLNYTIAASCDWVEKNCPELLTDDEYTYLINVVNGDGIEERKKYSDFVDKPDKDGKVIARFGWPYLEYKPENFGCHYYDDLNHEEEEEDKEDFKPIIKLKSV